MMQCWHLAYFASTLFIFEVPQNSIIHQMAWFMTVTHYLTACLSKEEEINKDI